MSDIDNRGLIRRIFGGNSKIIIAGESRGPNRPDYSIVRAYINASKKAEICRNKEESFKKAKQMGFDIPIECFDEIKEEQK